MAPLEGDKNQKRKRVLTAKAKAAIEQDEFSDGSIEPHPKKKSVARGKKPVALTADTKQDLGVRPDDAHPASLIRLKSPVQLRPSNPPPPRIQRKYASYSDALSGRSVSASEDETMSTKEEEDNPGSIVVTKGGNSSCDEAGSIVDFIDDRAEDDLSIDSVDSVEEPPVRKSRSSKKRGAIRNKSAASNGRASRTTKGLQPRRREDAGGSKVEKVIVISDSEDDGKHAPSRRNHKPTAQSLKAEEILTTMDNSEEDRRTVVGKDSSSRRRHPTQDRIEGRSREHRDKQTTRVANDRETVEDKGNNKKSRSRTEGQTAPPITRASNKRESSRFADTNDVDDESQPESDSHIDWPASPERPSTRRSKKAPRATGKDKKMEEAKNETALLPGQDSFLADSYASMEPLKHVELMPLFGSQDPPEEEALKISELMRLYDATPASVYLPKRLRDLLLFQQQGVLVNPARAHLNKVTTSNYGTSTYYVIPPSVVKPRNGSLPFYACFLMTGVCAYSYLYRPAEKNFGNRSIIDHRIGVYPMEFEYQRGLAYMANVAKKQSVRYSFTSGILAFTSKTEGSSDLNNSNFGASPKKSAFHRDRAVPPSQLSAANPILEYLRTSRFPAALSYSDNVPIFDARGSKFLTGSFDLSVLHVLPLITDDIEESSVVTVGYTSNTYTSTTGSLSGMEVLSMNVQFVVVHAGPPA